MPITDIVFDLGGVLVDWNPRYLYRDLIDNENEMEYFLKAVCNGPWNEQQDAGRSFADGIGDLVGRFPQHENLIRSYFLGWSRMLAGEISGTVEILSELRRMDRHRLFALSNWSAETFPYARASWSHSRAFDFH
jgi:2-haloacid dehalogenase